MLPGHRYRDNAATVDADSIARLPVRSVASRQKCSMSTGMSSGRSRSDGKAMARIFGPRPTTTPQLPPVRLLPEVAAAATAPEPIPAARAPRRSTWTGNLRPAFAMLPFTLSVKWRRRRKPSPPTLAEA